jgi:hypothetical protein
VAALRKLAGAAGPRTPSADFDRLEKLLDDAVARLEASAELTHGQKISLGRRLLMLHNKAIAAGVELRAVIFRSDRPLA